MIETSVFMMTMFTKIGLKVEDIYWTHAVKCYADRVTMNQVKECHHHLTNEIAMLQPAVIVALGSSAISSLAGEHININDAIGGEFEFDSGKQMLPVIPLYHPRTLMDLPEREFKAKTNQMWTQIKDISDYL
ncbi:Uracil DNA glycosylase superfamily protein [compost metagenome]